MTIFELFTGGTITADSATFNPAVAAQDLVSFSAPENHMDYILVFLTLSIEQTATSAAQTLTINIAEGPAGSQTVLKAYTFKTYAALKYDLLSLVTPVRHNTNKIIRVQLAGAAGADAQTAIIVKNFMVAGVDQGRT